MPLRPAILLVPVVLMMSLAGCDGDRPLVLESGAPDGAAERVEPVGPEAAAGVPDPGDHADVVAAPPAPPQLRLAKVAPESWHLCDELFPVTYTVTNVSDEPAPAAVVRDRYPRGVFGPFGGGEIDIDVPALAPGESFSETVHLRATAPGELTTSARVEPTRGGEGGVEEVVTTTTILQAALSIRIDGPGSVAVGPGSTHTALDYTLRITNSGNAAAAEARVHAHVGPGVEVVSPEHASVGDGYLVLPVGEVGAGQTREVRLTLCRQEPGSITLDAEVLAPCAKGAGSPGSDPGWDGEDGGDRAAATFTTHLVPEGPAAQPSRSRSDPM